MTKLAAEIFCRMSAEAQSLLLVIAHLAGKDEVTEEDMMRRGKEIVGGIKADDAVAVAEICGILVAAAIVLRVLSDVDQESGGADAPH